MKKLYQYLQIVFKLGIINVTYVIWYRISLKSGIRKYFFPEKVFTNNEELFQPSNPRTDYPTSWKIKILTSADRIIKGEFYFYTYHWIKAGIPPDWFRNYFNSKVYSDSKLHWTKLSDFSNVGDIKNVWELSRFEWVVTLSKAYAVSGKNDYLEVLNLLLNNWKVKNPLNIGPNWKCGQEASIRVFNLINASLILNQELIPSKSLCDFIYAHLQRINSNILYAIAQDNNHGTSEAAALLIGGHWLKSSGFAYPKASTFSKNGRKWIENRIMKLVEDDGSFSQHSVNYHRLLLDTLIFTEYWRQKLEVKTFSKDFNRKVESIMEWLSSMTDDISGNCPNLGANDGALFLNLHSCEYRDFRPSLQTAAAIFNTEKIFDVGNWDEPLYWFGRLSKTRERIIKKKISKLFTGGYIILYASNSWSLIRFPNYRFRPSQNDVFHFDLWFKGKNIIHDSGSYSYNPPKNEKVMDFNSVNAHNTVSFDNQEQMPVISRFLLGNWVEANEIGAINNQPGGDLSWQGAYTDRRGNIHKRIVKNKGNIWIIEDQLSGNFKVATIGFNLLSEYLFSKGCTIKTSWGEIIFKDGTSFEIIESYSSNYYMEMHPTKRVEIYIEKPQSFITEIHLQ
ncbi:MAG TPA: heparinase II/III family protein [Paludibacter sp.]